MLKKYSYDKITEGVSKTWKKMMDKELLQQICKKINKDYENHIIIPSPEKVFASLKLCEPKDVKVVIIGQDCYKYEEQAMGLAFSVPEGIKTPPSLKRIYKCLSHTLNIDKKSTDLTKWNKQGVLLLNCALTIIERKSGSHMKIWTEFTNSLFEKISILPQKIIFLLWGNFAKRKADFILNKTDMVEDFLVNAKKNLILTYTHPSPLARNPFEFCPHFKIVNECLEELDKKKIDWDD